MKSWEASKHSIITLTTDFGYRDTFVAQMKGVMLALCPSATLVDITHDIEPYSIRDAAHAIASTYRRFPKGTIHVGVVDPGVGSERRGVIVCSDGHFFVGPDNGIFHPVYCSEADARVFLISDARFVANSQSPTFQGRDVFAPAAAWLARGIAPEEFGPACADITRLDLSVPLTRGECVIGEVVDVDRFGNAITNITREHLAGFGENPIAEVAGITATRKAYYAAAEDRSLYWLVNSSGDLELFVREGSASRCFGIRKGEKVEVSPMKSRP